MKTSNARHRDPPAELEIYDDLVPLGTYGPLFIDNWTDSDLQVRLKAAAAVFIDGAHADDIQAVSGVGVTDNHGRSARRGIGWQLQGRAITEIDEIGKPGCPRALARQQHFYIASRRLDELFDVH